MNNLLENIKLNEEVLKICDSDARQNIQNVVSSLSTVATTGNYEDLNNKPSLSTVATTGNYKDLNNKPSLSTVATTGNYRDLNNKPSIPSFNYADNTLNIVIMED